MVAHYAAQVAHRDDGHQVSSHSPEHVYRQPTSNGNSVRLTRTFQFLSLINLIHRYLQ